LRSWRWAATGPAWDCAIDLGECRQPGERVVGLTDGHRTIEPHHRVVAQRHDLVVPLHDLHPVGVLDPGRIGMQRSDRGLRLVGTDPIASQGGLEDDDAFGDRRSVPQLTILLGERDQPTVGAESVRTTSVVQEHQCEQTAHLGFIDHGRQLARHSRIASAARSMSPE
jgi:hypothetical protein